MTTIQEEPRVQNSRQRPSTSRTARMLQSLRSCNNLFYEEQIDFQNLPLPEVTSRDFEIPDTVVAMRLADVYCRAMEHGGSEGNGVWERIHQEYHRQFAHDLITRNYNRIAHTLAGMFRNKIMYGLSSPEENKTYSRLTLHDVVISLGISSGILPARNPNDLHAESLYHQDYREVLQKYSEIVGYDLAPPQVGGIFGLEFNGNVVPLRHLFQIHAARRIKTLSNAPVSCLEIGGGVGFLAYAAVKMGSVEDHCIIDLPIVNVLQGYLLLKSDLADCVELFGERSQGRKMNGPRIRILPDNAVNDLDDRSFDVAVNLDSLPEMGYDTIRNYLRQIQRICRSYFLSVNQEHQRPGASGFSHGWVHEMIKEFPDISLVSRAPCWLRKGYVEELFRIINST